jgi:uncharacterized membrane protein/predicted flap endonuclease-1-like 5' DNA nuclease
MASKYSFLVIKYPWPDTADDALQALKELSDDKVVKLRDAVAIRKTENGKIKLHQTKDDTIGKGFVKGGVIGVLFAMLFGPAGWIAMGAAAGGLFASFDRGIKQKLLKELGQNMTASESAVAILVESADWPVAVERMKAHGFGGTLVLSEIVEQDEAEVDALLADPKKVAEAPEVLEVVAVAAAAKAVADEPEAAPVAAAAVAEPEPAPVPEEVAEAAEDVARTPLHEIEGVGPANADKLKKAGVTSTEELLAQGATASGRDRIASEAGIGVAVILDWVNRVDLTRVPGVGTQYSDLLHAAGVDSPAELAQRNPANLAITVQEVVAARPGIVRRIPSEVEISGWVDAAGSIDKVVQH